MLTFSGKNFSPVEPRAEQIDLLDIAVGLSRIPRFVGHTIFPYYVAQHCMMCCHMVNLGAYKIPHGITRSLKTFEVTPENQKRIKLLALLHDADEAYTSDIPSPVKEMLKPSIVEVESGIMDAIYKHLDIAPPTSLERSFIKSLDNKSYEIENVHLRGAYSQALLSDINAFPPGLSVPVDSNLLALAYMREVKLLME